MAGPVLQIEDLNASYGGPDIITGVDFMVDSGQIVGVIGPNGSGKTTLFNAITGTAQVTRGRVESPTTVAYVPQSDRSRHDFPISAIDVVLMGLYREAKWWQPLGRLRRQRALEAMATLKIDDLARQQFGELSGGQRQRVLVARALIQPTKLILMDEPFSHLDPASEQIIEAAVQRASGQGRTVLISTHDVEQARRCNLVLCLNHRQIAFGKPAEVLMPDVLSTTYGSELIKIGDGDAIMVSHHDHDHE